ncbi:toll/interleukin-1 receptor domain-containing protein [Promicromonospora sp. NPDC059942]|uniref:toll/interleukin-1 receptor domain-containing protein n=1 Tax=Promicromonospora sp. NPDC059942 TaxID=3347009 RepID=UPI003653B2DF
MIRKIVERVEDGGLWSTTSLIILLQQYGLESIDPQRDPAGRETEFARIVGGAADETLIGVYATVLDIDEEQALSGALVPDDHGLWNDGQVRVFLSHSATEREFVAEVSNELAVVGVHGFVAHETMQIERPWQAQIEVALRTAEAFVGLVHPRFNESAWCQQELGWANGRGLPCFLVRFGANPDGFAASTQWPSGAKRSARQVAHEILAWLERTTDFTDRIVEGLMKALETASDYYSAEAAAKRVVALGSLTETSWGALARTYWANDQVHGGVLPTRVLQPFFQKNGKSWPPPKPLPRLTPRSVDVRATALSSDPLF